MITKDQQAKILKAMEPYMMQDKFGRSTIRNIYFDTDDHILARHSIAKPDFKEKLRIRSYSLATEETTVFVELKRKFDHVVYKRRVGLPEHIAMAWTQGLNESGQSSADAFRMTAGKASSTAIVPTQMTKEIDYFLSYYGHLKPAVFLSYDRLAYRMRDMSPELNATGGHDQDFRVTFDENILFRSYDLSLTSDVYGTPLLEEGKVLMEIKCAGGIPLWMTKILSDERIYKTSFSKYGTAYASYIQPQQQRTRVAAAAGTYRQPAKHASKPRASSFRLRYLGA